MRDERVLKYLQRHLYITQKEAINKLGNYRLSASIFNLKKDYDIDGVFLKVYNRFRERTRIKAYYLKENEEKVLKKLRRLGYVD